MRLFDRVVNGDTELTEPPPALRRWWNTRSEAPRLYDSLKIIIFGGLNATETAAEGAA